MRIESKARHPSEDEVSAEILAEKMFHNKC